MKQTLKHAFAILPLLVIFTSCEKGLIGIKGKGEIVTQTFDLAEIKGVNLDLAGNIHLTQSETQSVSISAQQNIIDNIKMPVTGGIATFDFKKRVRKSDDVDIYISLKSLSTTNINGSGNIISITAFTTDEPLRININGSGDINLHVDAPEVDSHITGSGDITLTSITQFLNAEVTGSGDYHLNGIAKEANYDISGSGTIDGYDMLTETASVDISGSGDCNLSVTSKLTVSVDGSGNVRYKGDPNVSSSVVGSGDVMKVN